MRVLFWSEMFWPYIGGSQSSGKKLLLGLRERGYEFVVVTSHGDLDLPDKELFKGIPIYRFPFYPSLSAANLHQMILIRQQVAELKRAFAPDLVHINCFGTSVFFHLDTVNTHPAPLLFTLRGERFLPPDRSDTILAQTLRSAKWVTTPSKRTLEYARQLIPDFALPSSHIYNGMEMPPTLPTPLPIDAPRLLCLGRLVPNKGFDLALKALAFLKDRFPHVRLIIAGDGIERSRLEKEANDLGVKDRVDFIGWIVPEKVFELINTTTVVVVPSRGWEALPLVALEAAWMARPVVAARDGGLPEVVVHGKTGMLLEKEDWTGLAEALALLLERPEVASQMGKAARQRVQEVFSMQRCVDAYDDLYQKLGKQVAFVPV